MNYFNSTSAPASSKAFLTPSASSLLTPSFTAFGALSTISLASFKPKPVSSLTALTTCNFEPPAAFSMISNSLFSSAWSAPPEAPGAAATATAAAAGSIPYSSFNMFASSFTSFTERLTNF